MATFTSWYGDPWLKGGVDGSAVISLDTVVMNILCKHPIDATLKILTNKNSILKYSLIGLTLTGSTNIGIIMNTWAHLGTM